MKGGLNGAGPAALYFAVMAGSALGAVARYACSLGILALAGAGFPWGTLAVNVLGSFLIGLYASMSGAGGCLRASPVQSQFVMTGFCGGFTTFSIFSLETLLLAGEGQFMLAGANILLSLALWLVAVWLGYGAGARMNSRSAG